MKRVLFFGLLILAGVIRIATYRPVSILEDARLKSPNKERTWHAVSVRYLTKGDYARSIAVDMDAMEKFPNAIDFKQRAASSLLKLERYDEAISLFEESLDHRPGLAIGWQNLGVAYMLSGRPAPAVKAFQISMGIQEGNFWVVDGLITAAYQSGDLQGLDSFIDQHPFSRNYAYGKFEMLQGNNSEAARWLDLAAMEAVQTKMNATASLVHYNHGYVLNELGNYPAAAEAYTAALRSDPAMAEAWYNLAAVHLHMGQSDLADREFQRSGIPIH